MVYFFLLLYTFWIFLTVVKQFDKKIFGLSKYDFFAIIPNWTLFAPNPKFSDYKILFRDKLLDGSVGELNEIDWICNKKSNFLWKGQMREQKFLSYIAKETYKYKRNKIDLIFFYDNKTLMLKNFIKFYKVPDKILTRQLIVIETYGYFMKKEEFVVFVTNIKYANKYNRKY